MGDAASWASVVIAAVSMVVSLIAMFKSNKAQQEANAAQRKLVKIEEDRELERRSGSLEAHLKPSLRKMGSSYRLYIENSGAAEARNVRISMDGVPLSEHRVGGDQIPLIIGPSSEASCLLALSLANHPPFNAEIQWDDESGLNHSYRTTLTF
jgi:hypothetical protein